MGLTLKYRRRTSIPLIVCAMSGMTGPRVPVRGRFDYVIVDRLSDGAKVVVMGYRPSGECEVVTIIREPGREWLNLVGFTHVRAILDVGEQDENTSVYLENDDG